MYHNLDFDEILDEMSKFVFVLITNGTIRSSSNATYLLPGHRGTYVLSCKYICSLVVLGMFIIGYGLWPMFILWLLFDINE